MTRHASDLPRLKLGWQLDARPYPRCLARRYSPTPRSFPNRRRWIRRPTSVRTVCSASDADARTRERPWGPNNPRWQLFAAGPIEAASPSGAVGSTAYVAVWVGDDALENDDNALVDGDESHGPNPGRGVLSLLAHAYGVSVVRRIEATVERAGPGVRVVSWREIR